MHTLRRLYHRIKPELTYDGGTASYHLGTAFLYSSPQIGAMQSPIQLYTDASGTCGYGAYTWMEPGSEGTAHTSASRAGRALEGRLRHLLHRAVAPSTSSATNRAGIRKYYAFCHKFNLTTLPRNQALYQPFYWVSQSNGE